MKKIFLFLLLVAYSFSIDGFDKLKWESSPEDFYKYYGKYEYTTYSDEGSIFFTLLSPGIYFNGEKLEGVVLIFLQKKLYEWGGVTNTSKEKALEIYNQYKKDYKSGKEKTRGNKKTFTFVDLDSKETKGFCIILTEYSGYSTITYTFSHNMQ